MENDILADMDFSNEAGPSEFMMIETGASQSQDPCMSDTDEGTETDFGHCKALLNLYKIEKSCKDSEIG